MPPPELFLGYTRRTTGGATTNAIAAPRSAERDLDDTDEIAELVRRFYSDVAQDQLLGPVFVDVAQVDWSEHLPKLTAFWCRALLGMPGYTGNPFRAHADVHARCPFAPEHFARWLELFEENLVLRWHGPNAERALHLARDVARVHSRQLLGTALASLPSPTQGDRP